MASSSFSPLSQFSSTSFTVCERPTNHKKKIQIGCTLKLTSSTGSSFSLPSCQVLHKSLPLAASVVVLLWSNPAKAGFLSGLPGLESIPGPKLPEIEFLSRFNEENQKRYAEADAKFKSSPLLKEYLEKTKLNKEKNRQETQDKYCLRGAEWGVGDCSAEAMSIEDKEKFILALKEKVGVK
ncbi:Acetyl-CoA decarbonylase/synthase complex [Fagus crenata]